MVTSRLGLVEIWAPGADPDGDERPNAMEACLGSNPLEADRTNRVDVLLTDTRLSLRFREAAGSSGPKIDDLRGEAVPAFIPEAGSNQAGGNAGGEEEQNEAG